MTTTAQLLKTVETRINTQALHCVKVNAVKCPLFGAGRNDCAPEVKLSQTGGWLKEDCSFT